MKPDEARRDVLSGVALLAGAVALWVAIPHQVQTLEGESLTPASAPRALTFALGLLGAALAARGAWATGVRRSERHPGRRPDDDGTPAPRLALAGAAIAVLALYVAAIPWLGYLLATGVALPALAWLFGARRPMVLVALAVITPPVLFYFFRYTLLVLLPAGSVFQ